MGACDAPEKTLMKKNEENEESGSSKPRNSVKDRDRVRSGGPQDKDIYIRESDKDDNSLKEAKERLREQVLEEIKRDIESETTNTSSKDKQQENKKLKNSPVREIINTIKKEVINELKKDYIICPKKNSNKKTRAIPEPNSRCISRVDTWQEIIQNQSDSSKEPSSIKRESTSKTFFSGGTVTLNIIDITSDEGKKTLKGVLDNSIKIFLEDKSNYEKVKMTLNENIPKFEAPSQLSRSLPIYSRSDI